MKKVCLTLVCTLFVFLIAYSQGVQFETGTWKEALKKAKKEKKIVFVDVYTTWCGPCRMVAETVFPQEKVGKFYNENFINYRFDAEKGEGPEFAKKYDVKAYPSFFYIDGDGKVISQFVGAKDVDGFIESGKKIPLIASYGGYDKMVEDVKSGAASSEVFDIIYSATGGNEQNEILNAYLKMMPTDKFLTTGYKYIGKINEYDDELMQHMAGNLINASNDGRFRDGVFDTLFMRDVMTPFSNKTSDFLNNSIQNNDSLQFEKCLALRRKCDAFSPVVMSQFGDFTCTKDKLFFTSPDYIQLCNWYENKINAEQFKEKLISFMDSLMKKNPLGEFRMGIVRFSAMAPFSGLPQEFLKLTYMTSDNILNWTDYCWKTSPCDEKSKAFYMEWIKYAYNMQFYDQAIIQKAANFVNKIDGNKQSAKLLEDALTTQVQIRGNKKVITDLEFLLNAAQNNKL